MSPRGCSGAGLCREAAGHTSTSGLCETVRSSNSGSLGVQILLPFSVLCEPRLLTGPWASVSSPAKGNSDLFHMWVSGNFWLL